MPAFTAYEGSQLQGLINNHIASIEAHLSKYPEEQHETSLRKKARKQLQNRGRMVGVLNTSILPALSNGQIPGTSALVKAGTSVGYNIRQLFPETPRSVFYRHLFNTNLFLKDYVDVTDPTERSKIKTTLFKDVKVKPAEHDDLYNELTRDLKALRDQSAQQNVLLNWKIAIEEHLSVELLTNDLMMYEFSEVMIKLLDELPSSLPELIPFFNPKSLTSIHEHWVIAAIIRAFMGKFTLTHSSPNSDEVSYQYVKTTNDVQEHIDLRENYKLNHRFYLNSMKTFRRRFLSAYEQFDGELLPPIIRRDLDLMRRERAANDMLREYVSREITQINQDMATSRNDDQTLSLINKLEEKKFSYASVPVYNLLEEPFKSQWLKNQSDQSTMLPDTIENYTYGTLAITGKPLDVKVILDRHVDNQISRLRGQEVTETSDNDSSNDETEQQPMTRVLSNRGYSGNDISVSANYTVVKQSRGHSEETALISSSFMLKCLVAMSSILVIAAVLTLCLGLFGSQALGLGAVGTVSLVIAGGACTVGGGLTAVTSLFFRPAQKSSDTISWTLDKKT